jgi:hypothetical protein
MRRFTLLTGLLILAIAPATAAGKLRSLPGTGETPAVAIGPDGTALVAWYLHAPTGEDIALCRIPRGTSRCPAPQILDATQGATSGVQPPLLRVSGATVDLVAARAGVVAMRSLDGGATFGAQVAIADRTYFTGAIGRDGTVVLGDGPELVRTSLGGPFEPRFVELNRGYGSYQAVGFAGGRPVYVSGGAAPTTAVRRWSGRGDIFDPATWSKRRRGPAMVYYDLDEGPRGLWLVHEHRTGIDDHVVVRRWRRGRFGPARTIPGSAGNVIGTAIAQDGRGRFAVAWYDSRGDRIRVAASRTGRRWSRARTIGHVNGIPSSMAIGLGGGGRGLVATDQGSTSKRVRVRRITVKGLYRR